MGRKNRRFESYIPLDLTPSDLDNPPVTEEQKARRDALRRESDAQRARRQAEARVNRGIDWSTCMVPGCGRALQLYEQHRIGRRDATLELPICDVHAAVVWNQLVLLYANNPRFVEAIIDVNERTRQRDVAAVEERKASNLANVNHGDIYFIRIGGLVKVGWTRNLWDRLKSYGASAELLVSYPGSRDDETNLHRQLRPALAKGREWYEDGAIITKFIDDALARYGQPPTFDGMWTQPKAVVAGKRAMRYR